MGSADRAIIGTPMAAPAMETNAQEDRTNTTRLWRDSSDYFASLRPLLNA